MSRIYHDRNDNPNRRRPKQRPSGYSYQRYGSSSDSRSGHHSDRPRPQPRPAPPPRPAGPARIEPLEPTSGKQRRRMAKGAAWRLAKLLHVRPADVMATPDLEPMLDKVFPNRGRGSGRGPAARLANKVRRLVARK